MLCQILLQPAEGGTYDLYNFNSNNANEPAHGSAISVAFVSRARFVTLERNRHISLRNLSATSLKRIPAPYTNADQLFQAGTSGRVMVRSGDKLCLFETASQRVLHEIQGISVRYTAWDPDLSQVALIGKHSKGRAILAHFRISTFRNIYIYCRYRSCRQRT